MIHDQPTYYFSVLHFLLYPFVPFCTVLSVHFELYLKSQERTKVKFTAAKMCVRVSIECEAVEVGETDWVSLLKCIGEKESMRECVCRGGSVNEKECACV